MLAALLVLSCTCNPLDPVVGEPVRVVDSPGIPGEVTLQQANNNLDVTWHDGGVFLAFRTAPDHFASADATLHVLRSEDEVEWTFEASFHQGSDLREPRLLSWKGELFLYFAVLGDDAAAFEPEGTMMSVRSRDGTWSEPTWLFEDSFIPWRTRPTGDRAMMIGYTGGSGSYQPGSDEPPGIEVRWLGSTDGWNWEAWVEDQEVVLVGGGSETDLAWTDDGGIVAVVRNEGDPWGFGSRICRADAHDLGSWDCIDDPRKYDSPLLFRHDGRTWLVARRSLDNDGVYDLGMDDLEWQEQWLQYELAWWHSPKRCSLWEVHERARSVDWVADLPSRGDTCFASIVARGIDRYAVYNYSSDPDGPELSWFEGQTGETWIYRQDLSFER